MVSPDYYIERRWRDAALLSKFLIRLSDLEAWLVDTDSALSISDVCLISSEVDLKRAYVFADDLAANMAWATYPIDFPRDQAVNLLAMLYPDSPGSVPHPVEQIRIAAEYGFEAEVREAVLTGALKVCDPITRKLTFDSGWMNRLALPSIPDDGIITSARGDRFHFRKGKWVATLRKASPRAPRMVGVAGGEAPIAKEASTPDRKTNCWTDADISEMRRLNESGMSQKVIGDRYGISRERVGQLLRSQRGSQQQKAACNGAAHNPFGISSSGLTSR